MLERAQPLVSTTSALILLQVMMLNNRIVIKSVAKKRSRCPRTWNSYNVKGIEPHIEADLPGFLNTQSELY
jgi:hypothetical protein